MGGGEGLMGVVSRGGEAHGRGKWRGRGGAHGCSKLRGRGSWAW